MTAIKGGHYLTVEEYRKKYGLSNCRSIYRAIHDGRIHGAVKVGQWLIPFNAVMLDGRVRHGLYIGLSKRIKDSRKTVDL